MAFMCLSKDIIQPSGKINIDHLFQNSSSASSSAINKEKNNKCKEIYTKILCRVHQRIENASRLKKKKDVLFIIPTFVFGEILYRQTDCIAFLMHKLTENGFDVQYLYPNHIHISWQNYISIQQRQLHKKKTGIDINEKGIPIQL